MTMPFNNSINIASLHWGFIPGGVAAYARSINDVESYLPLAIKSICITAPSWPIDDASSKSIRMELIHIQRRLDFSWLKALRVMLKKEKPVLILTHGFNGVFVAALASVGLGIPIISSWHGDYYPSTPSQRLRKPLFDALLKVLYRFIVKDIVTVSEFSKTALVTKGINEQKIQAIHNGIPDISDESDKREEVRKSLGIAEDCLLIGTACRLASQKGLQWFLHAIALIVKKRQDVRFVIWGDGPLKDELTSLANSLEINSYITFAGYRSDIVSCLPSLDVFVMSSFAEFFSIALLEAMRAALPIVATRVGGNPEAIEEGAHGILVPFADPAALADGVLKLLSDDVLRQAMATRARERFLAEFTSDKMVEKTAQWLMECARRHSSQIVGEVSS